LFSTKTQARSSTVEHVAFNHSVWVRFPPGLPSNEGEAEMAIHKKIKRPADPPGKAKPAPATQGPRAPMKKKR
jgi:hypothetical protein